MNMKKFIKKDVAAYTDPSFKHGPRVASKDFAKALANIDAGYLCNAMEVGNANSYTMDPYETTYGKHCKPCGKLTDV